MLKRNYNYQIDVKELKEMFIYALEHISTSSFGSQEFCDPDSSLVNQSIVHNDEMPFSESKLLTELASSDLPIKSFLKKFFSQNS